MSLSSGPLCVRVLLTGYSYGYQWWLPESGEGEFTAIGVYNQFIYVNPVRELVIVKLSANNAYATELDGSADQEFETIEFFRAIGSKLATSGSGTTR